MNEQSRTISNIKLNRSSISLVLNFLQSLPVLGAILFIYVTTFPPFEVATEINLSVHMLQHVLIVIAGVLITYPLYRAGKFAKVKSTEAGLFGFLVISVLLTFWHIPFAWDAAVLNPAIHITEHFCFLLDRKSTRLN